MPKDLTPEILCEFFLWAVVLYRLMLQRGIGFETAIVALLLIKPTVRVFFNAWRGYQDKTVTRVQRLEAELAEVKNRLGSLSVTVGMKSPQR